LEARCQCMPGTVMGGTVIGDMAMDAMVITAIGRRPS